MTPITDHGREAVTAALEACRFAVKFREIWMAYSVQKSRLAKVAGCFAGSTPRGL